MSFKKKLNQLKIDLEIQKPEFTLPDDTPVTCCECDWKGIISDCETEMDSEGWEYPEYEVLVCPKCEEYSIEF